MRMQFKMFERKEGLPCKSKLKSCELCSDISCYAWNPIVFTVRGWILTCLVSTNFFPPPHSTINNQINTAEDFKDKTRPIETKCDVNKSKAGVFSARCTSSFIDILIFSILYNVQFDTGWSMEVGIIENFPCEHKSYFGWVGYW